jgi:ABC-type Fe3+ transport system substrate-binding protein
VSVKAEIEIFKMRTIRLSDSFYVLALLLLLAVPFLLKPAKEAADKSALPLVIISPHNEAVQFEFERAFRQWRLKNGEQDIDIDWRNIGGTSEIARYIDSSFQAAEKAGLPGIGIDLFFGGGEYDHSLQAKKGHTVQCGVRERHPELLNESIIPAGFSGEKFYDRDDRWYGCCLSGFGICYNEDFFKTMKAGPAAVPACPSSAREAHPGFAKGYAEASALPMQKGRAAASMPRRLNPPRAWEDLADYRLFEHIALADPTKSGSINKAFEMLIQEQIFSRLKETGKTAENAQQVDLAEGWQRAFNLIRQIGANARYFTDSAGKVTVDVAQGNAAAGMCIDFYGRFESETVERNENSTRVKYVMPENGSSISVDPISMLRGAPNRALAEQFIDFCLSVEGQLIWNTRVGRPGGPVRYSLRRLPVRRDLYVKKYLDNMSDPQALPYEHTGEFIYQSAWTGPYFNIIRTIIKTMCIDTHDELRQAWRSINEAGGPAACPRAMAVFSALPPGAEYGGKLDASAKAIAGKLEEARLMREWTEFFRDQYRKAAEVAEEEGRRGRKARDKVAK